MKKVATRLKAFLAFSLSFFSLCTLPAQSVPWFWSDAAPLAKVQASVEDSRLLELNLLALQAALNQAPAEFRSDKAPLLMRLPMADGSEELVEVVYSPVMEPGLAARYPHIKAFRIRGQNKRNISGRFSISHLGFHGAFRTPKGDMIIESAPEPGTQYYQAYYRSALSSSDIQQFGFFCPHQEEPADPSLETTDPAVELRSGEPVALRVYRFALISTGEYARLKGTTLADLVAAYNRSVNRMNQILEQEFSVRLVLINDTERLIFLDPATDPFSNANSGTSLLGQVVGVLNNLITDQAYDLGHLFTASCTDVGGVAGGAACTSGKGAGVTCHSNNEEAVLSGTAVHEIGHQLTCGHSWNNCPPNQDQLSSANAYEPGSGTTIMSYVGVCGADNNVANRRDTYFNAGSLVSAISFTQVGAGSSCGREQLTNNHLPEVRIEHAQNLFIPKQTPFELVARATDEDGDSLSYCWEQFDLGPPSTLGSPQGTAPAFRSFPPNTSPSRVFPRLPNLVANFSFPTEVLPRTTRPFTFRCVVRDNNPEAGGIAMAEIKFRSDSTAGPFLVLSPNTSDETWAAGDYKEVRWDVAGTDNSRVNCRLVNIRLSLDGGFTYPITLLRETPNDGSAFVSVPDISSNRARIRVEGSGNIFFDISNADFRILPAARPGFAANVSPSLILQHCLPEPLVFELDLSAVGGFSDPLQLGLFGVLPQGTTYRFSENPVAPGKTKKIQLSIQLPEGVNGTFRPQIRISAPGQDTVQRDIAFTVISPDIRSLQLLSPANGQRGIVLSTSFRWSSLPGASGYDFELATSPAFGESIIERATNIRDTTYVPKVLFDKNKILYWRIRPVTICPTGYTLTKAFQTLNETCENYTSTNVPVNITGRGLPTVESSLTIDKAGIIRDLNIPLIRANYQPVRSLRVSLISPAGTEVVLYNRDCGNTILLAVGYDDEAPQRIICPPDDQIVFQPLEVLSRFDGENTLGTWKLRTQVVASGFGASGAIENWGLQFCADFSPSNPSLLKKETLLVGRGNTALLGPEQLAVGDPDQGPEALRFVLLSSPAHGQLLLSNRVLAAGDGFTQRDIDQGLLRYAHNGGEEQSDQFQFQVEDGVGGWLPDQTFDIRIDDNTSRREPAFAMGLRLFPNPARDEVSLSFDQTPDGPFVLRIFNLSGQLLSESRYDRPEAQIQLSTAHLPDGVYFISVGQSGGIATRKLVIARF